MKRIKLFEEFRIQSNAKIGLYHDDGVDDSTVYVWDKLFDEFFTKQPIKLDSISFKKENFKDLDLLIIPGGNSFQQRLGMSDESILDMQDWLKNGGKILAVCAGFHLLAKGHDWSLDLLPVEAASANLKKPASNAVHVLTEDQVNLDFEVTEFGKKVFGTNESIINLYYHGGPIVVQKHEDNFEVLLRFAEEVPHALPSPNFTKGSIASLYSRYGEGKIISISPHIEKTENYRVLMSNAIQYILSV